MPESAPPGVPAHAAEHGPEALTPEAIEAVLADFRSWLQQAAVPPAEAPPGAEGEPLDLHTLLGQFVALRHEVNLQTRATRAQQELNAEALRHLEDSLHVLKESRTGLPAPPEGEEEARPLLKTLVDLYDALALARRELQRVQETTLPLLAGLAEPAGSPVERPPPEPTPSRPPSFWSRWFGGGAERQADAAGNATRQALEAEQQHRRQAAEAAGRVRGFLESVITGYTMSLQRLERALRQHGLEPIPCVGEPFDPERMEVLEVVADSGRPANEVLDEVRRGYLWNGRVFRYAQVRVARS
jgi:molecular chaperone GrpE